MKIDIVNPIPAKSAAPIICVQELWSGKELILSLMKIHEKKVIPISFPKNSPKIIPYPKLVKSPSTIPDLKVMLVFAKAKIGMIKKFTGR